MLADGCGYGANWVNQTYGFLGVGYFGLYNGDGDSETWIGWRWKDGNGIGRGDTYYKDVAYTEVFALEYAEYSDQRWRSRR